MLAWGDSPARAPRPDRGDGGRVERRGQVGFEIPTLQVDQGTTVGPDGRAYGIRLALAEGAKAAAATLKELEAAKAAGPASAMPIRALLRQTTTPVEIHWAS